MTGNADLLKYNIAETDRNPAMRTVLAVYGRPSSNIADLSARSTPVVRSAASQIVNKFLLEREAARGRQALRALDRRLLDDIGLTPNERDRLLD